MNATTFLQDFPPESYKDWEVGLTTKTIYRFPDDMFEINDISDGWTQAIVDKETMIRLLNGEESLLNIKFS